MKEIMHGMRKCGVFMTFLLAFAMLSGMLLHARAAENTGEAYDGEVTGSITVTLPELEGMNNEDVQINLYRVGDLDTSNGYLDFSLVTELGDVNVNLNDIATAAENEAMAQTLAEAVEAREIEAVQSLWTDADGAAVFGNLTQGMYLITEGNANAYGTFSASLVPVPYADETSWNYEVEITPKANAVTTLGRIDVTKKVKGITSSGNLQDVHAADATYYIGLFMDAEGEHPYGGEGNSVKAVHIIDGSSGTVSFDNLPIKDGQPYYVFETTEEGEPITYLTQQGTENGFYCMAGEDLMAEGYDRAPAVSLEDEADGVGNAVISNVYSDGLPDGYYYAGEITISKSIMDNGQMIASDDTFYAGVFAVDAQGNESANPTEVVKLNNNGMVTVEVPLGGTDGTEPISYSVKETGENGVPIDKATFSYTVTGEGTVNLSIDQTTGTINITNTLGNNEGYYQEDPSTEASGDGNSGNGGSGSDTGSNGSSGSGSGTNRSSSSTKTGDNNPIMLYAGLLAAAVILGGIVVVSRRRHKE